MSKHRFICHWKGCKQLYDNVEALFEHLSDDHVGRRSTNNLCLTCYWNDCGATAAKRGHLANHVKIHLPFKRKYYVLFISFTHTHTHLLLYIAYICLVIFKSPQTMRQASLISHTHMNFFFFFFYYSSKQKCRKPFKRPQDLKKHEKTHTIEHQGNQLVTQKNKKKMEWLAIVWHSPIKSISSFLT